MDQPLELILQDTSNTRRHHQIRHSMDFAISIKRDGFGMRETSLPFCLMLKTYRQEYMLLRWASVGSIDFDRHSALQSPVVALEGHHKAACT